MSKKTPLSTVIGSIQSNKSRTIPREQVFARPERVPEQGPQDQKITYPPHLPPDEKITQGPQSTGDALVSEDQIPSSNAAVTTDQNTPLDDKAILPTKPRLTREERTALTLENLRKGYTRIPNTILIEVI